MAVVTLFSYKLRAEQSSKCSRCSWNSDVASRAMPHVCMVHKWLICVWIAIIGFLVFGIIASVLIVDTIRERQRGRGGTQATALPDATLVPELREELEEETGEDAASAASTSPLQNITTAGSQATSNPSTIATSAGSQATSNHSTTATPSTTTRGNKIPIKPTKPRTTPSSTLAGGRSTLPFPPGGSTLLTSNTLPTTTKATTNQTIFITPSTLPTQTTQRSSTSPAVDKLDETAIKEIIFLILVIIFGIGIAAVLTVVVLIRICCPEGKNKYKRIRSKDLQEKFTQEQSYVTNIHQIFTLPIRKPKIRLYTVSKSKYRNFQRNTEPQGVLIFSDDLRPPSYEDAIKCQDYHDYFPDNYRESPPHYVRY